MHRKKKLLQSEACHFASFSFFGFFSILISLSESCASSWFLFVCAATFPLLPLLLVQNRLGRFVSEVIFFVAIRQENENAKKKRETKK
jgi:hypothetical protein